MKKTINIETEQQYAEARYTKRDKRAHKARAKGRAKHRENYLNNQRVTR